MQSAKLQLRPDALRRRWLCGLPIEIEGPAELWSALPSAAPSASPALRVSFNEGPPPPIAGRLLVQGRGFAVAEAHDRLELELVDRSAPGRGPRLWARLDAATRRCEVVFAPSALPMKEEDGSAGRRAEAARPEQLDDLLIDEVLPELVVAQLWPLWGFAYLHASATLSEGRARLFLGHSGAGKSTAARLLVQAGDRPFCEDRCVARPGLAAAAPWHGGESGAGLPAPLEGLYVLDRSGAAGPPRPLAPAEALRAILPHAFLPRWWPPGLDAALAALGKLAEEATVQRLSTSKERVELRP